MVFYLFQPETCSVFDSETWLQWFGFVTFPAATASALYLAGDTNSDGVRWINVRSTRNRLETGNAIYADFFLVRSRIAYYAGTTTSTQSCS